MNTKKFFGYGVFAVIFALAFIACDDGSGHGGSTPTGNTPGGNVDTALNGTWLEQGSIEWKFNNGNFEIPIAYGRDSDGKITDVILGKGTYTTSGSKITMTLTHMQGDLFGLESRWYSKNELKSALVPAEFSEKEFEEYFVYFSLMLPVGYSVSGNTLTLTSTFEGETWTTTLTKK